MATSNAPRGLVLAKKNGSGSNSTGIDTIDWEAVTTVPSSGLSTDMFTGDPIIAYASSSVKPSPADATDKCIGVFQGCSFVNSSGEQKFSRHWTGGTTATDIKIFVSRDPSQTYFIQASATVTASTAQGLVGKPVNMPWALGTGSTKTGQSGYVLTPTGTDAESNLRVIRRAPWDTGTGASIGVTDAYPWYEVRLNQHFDNYVTTTVSTA
jgi:hypothetical protein